MGSWCPSYSTMRKYPHNLPKGLEYINDYTIRKSANMSLGCNVVFMEALCSHLTRNPDPLVVPVSNFRRGKYFNGVFNYTYDMQALLMLHTDEKRIINKVYDRWDRADEFPSQSKDLDILQFWHDYPALMRFLDRVLLDNRHHDIHDGNIMVDEEDNYRLVDLEGFINGFPLNHPYNKWIQYESQVQFTG